VTSGHFTQLGIYVVLCIVALAAVSTPCRAQSGDSNGGMAIDGYVRDSSSKPVVNVAVGLISGTSEQPLAASDQITRTDSEGHYRFEVHRAGMFSLRAQMYGYDDVTIARVSLARHETTKIDLTLWPTKASDLQDASEPIQTSAKPNTQAPQYYDEPQFTVAGVTQATSSGGHGSDMALRTTEALARATVSLSREPSKEPGTELSKGPAGSSSAAISAASENSLRDAVVRNPDNFDANRRLGKMLLDNGKAAEAVPYLERAAGIRAADAEVHHLLGDAEEKAGNPLEAVREFQRAAELDPSEPNLFDWGTELLSHRALEPATEVLTKGSSMFPQSVRILVALGVAWYARGSYEQAAQYLGNASDLDPRDPTPYLFLGRMQSVETMPSEIAVQRLGRFAELQPDNPLANYYYAVALFKQLWTQSAGAADKERSGRVEALLLKAEKLDSKLGAAYLQLGILYSERGDFRRAISAYEKTIEVSREEASPPDVDQRVVDQQLVSSQVEETLAEAHYRLAQAYLRIGDKAKAQEQFQLHAELSKKTKGDSERERREIQEFVISLRKKDSTAR
jgi:tetratricopeptide (TPR) repeat protein